MVRNVEAADDVQIILVRWCGRAYARGQPSCAKQSVLPGVQTSAKSKDLACGLGQRIPSGTGEHISRGSSGGILQVAREAPTSLWDAAKSTYRIGNGRSNHRSDNMTSTTDSGHTSPLHPKERAFLATLLEAAF